MSIFDEAIREHLELKRQHGAAEPELQELEDEAFGPPARPGETAVAEHPPVDEAPTTVQPAEPVDVASEPAPDAQPPEEADEPLPEPAETSNVRAETEEHPPPEGAVEPEETVAAAPAEPEEPAPADQPTELYEVEGEPAAADGGEDVVEDEFFSEQSLSDELDQALDAPEAAPEAPPAPGLGEPDLGPGESALPAEELAEDEQAAEGVAEPEEGEEEDVLEETPEFLQDSPEHDRLWFEQKPPKDFDFDD